MVCMKIQLTRLIEKVMTQDLLQKIDPAALEFPELERLRPSRLIFNG